MAGTNSPTIEKARSLTEVATSSLEEEIVTGRLRPRERLTEVDIAQRLGVSRAPVREALRMLERDGLVIRSGQSFVVAEITIDEAEDIFETVAFMEELYTRRATPHLTAADVRELRDTVNEMASIAAAANVAAYDVVNRRFHAIVARACPNPSLVDLVDSVGKRTLRFRRFAMTIPEHLPRSVVDHARIVDAIEAGDAAAAGKAASRAARETFKRLSKVLRYVGRVG